MTTGKFEIKTLLTDMEFEFPIVNQNFINPKTPKPHMNEKRSVNEENTREMDGTNEN